MYFWGQRIDSDDQISEEIVAETNVPADATVDEIDQILDDVDLEGLDAELKDIEAEL